VQRLNWNGEKSRNERNYGTRHLSMDLLVHVIYQELGLVFAICSTNPKCVKVSFKKTKGEKDCIPRSEHRSRKDYQIRKASYRKKKEIDKSNQSMITLSMYSFQINAVSIDQKMTKKCCVCARNSGTNMVLKHHAEGELAIYIYFIWDRISHVLKTTNWNHMSSS